MTRREESIHLLAHSLEAIDKNRAFDVQAANPWLSVTPHPERDYAAEATALYEAELDKLVMAKCNERIDRLWKPEPIKGEAAIDNAAVDRFAAAMKGKLAVAREKGRGGWHDKADCSQEALSSMLRAHVEKGDPRDVANFCMMLHQRGEAILPALSADKAGPDDAVERAARALYASQGYPLGWDEAEQGYRDVAYDLARTALTAAAPQARNALQESEILEASDFALATPDGETSTPLEIGMYVSKPDGGFKVTFAPLTAAPQAPVGELYAELLYAVGNKHEGETRHETALRYIRQAEQSSGDAASDLSHQQPASGENNG